jgi:hypothetical protein
MQGVYSDFRLYNPDNVHSKQLRNVCQILRDYTHNVPENSHFQGVCCCGVCNRVKSQLVRNSILYVEVRLHN